MSAVDTALDAAHDYLRRGWAIVPLHGYDLERGVCRCGRGPFCPEKNRGKHPVMDAWQKNPLRSGADVQAWYEDHPDANVGILTGVDSGIFVFDVDGAAGVRSVTDFTAEHGALPPTRIVRTGSGGLHYFFKHPGHFTVRGSTSWLAPGIDIRGYGGQVVAPPSRSGRGPYEVIADHPVAEAPQWLLDLLREHSRNYDAGHTASVKPAERVDVEFLPPRVRDLASTLIGEDEGRHKHFHGLVAACFESGYSQGQTVTIVAPWCAAVNKFVGRVESEVARSWGKLEAEAKKANDWLPGVAGPMPDQTQPDPAPATGTASADITDPTSDGPTDDDTDDQTAPELAPTWRPVDLDPILNGTYQPEEPSLYPRTDGRCLMYAGRVHSFHGESESGKSLVVQAESARLVRAGDDVLYIDFESDAAAVVGRLLDLGCGVEEIRSHFTYLRPDNDPRKFPHEREQYAAVLANTYALAVIDGMTDALGVFGASSTDNDEIASFMRSFPRLVAVRTEAAVVVIDHVTKDADSRGRFALGGQAKMNALDGSAFVVEIAEPLGRGMKGAVVLRVAKDRLGGVRPHAGIFRKTDRTQEAARVVIDSTGETIVVTVEAPDGATGAVLEDGRELRPGWLTTMMERVSMTLENAGESLSKKGLETRTKGKASGVREALKMLIDDGFVAVVKGARGDEFTTATAYRSTEDELSEEYLGWVNSATSSHLVPTSSPAEGTTSSPVPLPLRGGDEVSDEETTLTSSPEAGRGYVAPMDVSCKSCFRPTPDVIARVWGGLCGSCANDAGLVS